MRMPFGRSGQVGVSFEKLDCPVYEDLMTDPLCSHVN